MINEMIDKIDWKKTTFEGSRIEQLKMAKAFTIRQRLEAMDELFRLSERIQAMRKTGSTDQRKHLLTNHMQKISSRENES